MPADTFTLRTADNLDLFVYRWLPEQPRAIVQIAHGLAEHAGRYARLAAALNAAGYAVYADDHRGHGRTARTRDELGWFAESDGWNKAVDDLWRLNRRIAAEHAGLPIILLGHSMGAALSTQFLAEHGDAVAACALSGPPGRPPAIAKAGPLVAKAERARLGPRGRSMLLHNMSFGAFNKPFEPARTPFDWLSRDPAEVDRYAADPLCGFVSTVQFWHDFLIALNRLGDSGFPGRLPAALPIFVVAGAEDPVGGRSGAVQGMVDSWRAAGLRRIGHKFYTGARHELFNETNRDEVTADVIGWLQREAV